MYLQEIVEVAIGVIFAWLLISLATMQVQEIVARVLKKRARDLERAIENLLKDPEASSAEAQKIFKDFYDHPLIESLKEPLKGKKAVWQKTLKDKSSLTWWEKWKKIRTANLPSYIPPETFATVLFDVVTDAGTENSPILKTLSTLNADLEKLSKGDKATVKAGLERIAKLGETAAASDIGERVQKEAKKELKKQVGELHKKYHEKLPQLDDLKTQVNDAIDDAHVDWQVLFANDALVSRVDAGIQTLLNNEDTSKLGKALRGLFADVNKYATDADEAIAKGRKNVENWFDNSMDRLSGWYKRWAQKIAFVIAFLIAAAFNVDSIYMAQELWRNPALREATSAYIEDFVAQNTVDAEAEATDTEVAENAETGTELNPSNIDLAEIQAELETLAFPTGWNQLEREKEQAAKRTTKPFFWLLKALGWLITAAAAMQGAPFWFDILKKLVNIRSTGIKPEEKETAPAVG